MKGNDGEFPPLWDNRAWHLWEFQMEQDRRLKEWKLATDCQRREAEEQERQRLEQIDWVIDTLQRRIKEMADSSLAASRMR